MRKALKQLWRVVSAPFRLVFWLFRKIYHWLRSIIQRTVQFITVEEEDTPLPDAFAKTLENPQGILFHINELRKHLMRAVIFLALTTAFSFAYTQQIIDLLAKPIGGLASLQAIDVTEPISVFMRVALLSGFALALPYIAFELWLFAAPGLSRRARLLGLIALPAVTLFFIGGMAFAYFIMLPTALPFLLSFMGISTIPRPSTYIHFVTSLLFWIGVAFEFPLIIYLLAGMGIVRAESLAKQWRLAVVIIAILAAAITPTVDPISMTLVMVPLVLLFFLSIGMARLAQRGRE